MLLKEESPSQVWSMALYGAREREREEERRVRTGDWLFIDKEFLSSQNHNSCLGLVGHVFVQPEARR